MKRTYYLGRIWRYVVISKDFKMNSEDIGAFWQKYVKRGIVIDSPNQSAIGQGHL